MPGSTRRSLWATAPGCRKSHGRHPLQRPAARCSQNSLPDSLPVKLRFGGAPRLRRPLKSLILGRGAMPSDAGRGLWFRKSRVRIPSPTPVFSTTYEESATTPQARLVTGGLLPRDPDRRGLQVAVAPDPVPEEHRLDSVPGDLDDDPRREQEKSVNKEVRDGDVSEKPAARTAVSYLGVPGRGRTGLLRSRWERPRPRT